MNNVVVEKSDQYKENYTPSTTTNSHLYGQIVTTNATVNVDGKVEAKQVDITADAVNRYVSAESSVLNASNVTSNIVGALTANLDASYAVLNSKAEVNVGQSAEINATGSDTVSEGKVVKPALNIKANSSVEAGAGASTALLKVMNVAGTNIIPAAAVTYSQTHNEAAVNIDGTLKSTGGTSVTALANSKVNSEAKATTMDVSENPNLGDVALNITTGDNKSSVTIGKTAQMTELQKDVNIEAKSVNSVITKAEVSTGEKAVVATAINVTDYDSKANVNINGNVSSKDGSLSVNAENVLTDNTVIANNAMGSSAFMKKIVTNIKGSQSLDSLIGENGAKDQLLGGIKKWLANAKYTPQKLKDKLNAPSTPSAPTQPKPWDKLADFMSTGVSVGVAVESNTADVKIGQGVALAAKNDLNITAKSVIEDTQMQITGKSNNYDKDTSNKALVNASVLYGKLDNTATVTVAGGEEAQGSAPATNVTLTGGKVNIAANSSFEYNRINRMVQEVKDACAKVKAAYKGENHADIEAKADALSNAADAFFNYAKDNCFSSNGGEQVDFMDLFGGQKFKDFTDACSALTGALGNEATDIAVGPLNVVSAAAAFANPNSYLNFSAGSANGGKSGPGENEKPATIALAGSAVATDLGNNARVLIGKNAKITAANKLAMKAASKQFDVSLAGKLGLNGGGENAVGGTFAVGLADANSLVAVAQGAKLTAGSIDIGTENKIDHIQLSLAAGKGADKGVSGMVGYLEGASNSLVSVDDEAVINAGTGAVNLNAKNDTNVYSAAGAVALGGTAGIGVAATITNFDRYTYAAIGDNGYTAPPQATTEQGESGSDSGDTSATLGEDANADRSQEAKKLANTAAEKRATLQQLVQNASGLRQGTDDGKNYTEQADFFGSKTAADTKGSINAGSFKVNAETGGRIINVAVAGGVSTADDSGEVGIFDKLGNFVSNKTNALTNKLHALDHKVAGKINGLMDRQTEAQKVLPTDQKPTATPSGQQSSVTIAGAGSAAINLLDGDTGALVDNVKININDAAKDKTITVTAKDTAMMVAAGGAAGISWKKLTKDNNANSHNAAFGGTVAVNDIDSQTLAVISNSEIENAAAIINNAQKSGSLAAAGLGLALAKNSGGNGGTNIAATVNASVNIADNTAYALLQNNKVNNENVSGEDKRATSITNTAFDNDIQITGGVNTSLSIGGDNAFVGGATVSYGSLKNDVQAAILGGTYDKITTADVKATTNMTQVGVAANVSVAGGAKTSYAFSGNSAYNKLDNYANATVEGVTLTGESLNVAAYDTAESANTQAEYLKKRGLDADGSAYLAQVKEAADESGDSDKPTNVDITRGGNVIVTGAVSVGVTTGNDGGSAAASVTVSDIDNDYNAKIKDSNITTTGKGIGDALVGTNVNAASHTVLAGFAAGVAGTAGSFGVGGSANWQSLNNDITAAVENSTLVTPKTDVKAESGALAVNVAGQIGVTAGSKSKVGAGLAVAYNSLNNTTGAYVKGSEISGANDDASSILTVDAANKGNVYSVGAAVTAGTANALNGVVVVNRGRNDVEAVIDKYDGRRTKLNNMSKVAVKSSDDSNQLAVVGAVSVSAGSNAKFAAGGSVAYNEIGNITGSAGEKKQTNKAAINNADITTTEDGKISVNAVDESTLTTISVGTSITTGNVAFSGAGSAAMIKKDTDTELVNTNINKDKNNAATVQATADSKGKITTVAVVAAGAKDAAIGAGIAVNQLDADTNTTVTKGKYKVKGFTAEAKSDSSILSVGVAGGVAKTAGIAGNIGVNLLANDTKATIDGAKINADGTLAVIAKSKDTLQNFAGAFGVAAGGQAGVGMGVAYNEISGTTESVVKNNAELTAAGNDAGVAVNERNKDNDNVVSDKKRTGVIIAADAEHKLTNVAISGGVAVSADVGVGVAGTVTVNRILGATNATATDSSINATLTDRSKADVYVAANDATKSESHVGSLGVGGGADGGAGFGLASDTGVVSRNVTAMIDGGSAKKLVNGNSIDVAALNKAKMSTNSYGIAAAGGAYGAGAGAGTVSVAKLNAETTAAVKNIQGTNNGLAITADHVNDITLRSAAAAASGALVSAAGGAGIGVVDDDSKTVAELSGSNVKAETGDITVNAANKTDVTTAVFGVAASMVAGGLNVAVNNLDNTVSTLVKDNSNLQAQGTFAAKADNIVKTSFVNGANAVGAAGVAVGVGVNTIDTGVITEISGSKITAGAIDVAATEKLDVKQVVENAALGGHGYSANVSVTTIGAAAADQYGDSETKDSDKKATFNTNDILDKANAAIAGQGTVGTFTDEEGKTGTNAAGMTFDKYTGSNGQKLNAAPSTTASKGSSKAEGVQAKVSNSTLQATGDTKVNAKRTVDAKLTSAQVAGGIAGNGIAASVAVLDVERKTGVTINNNSKLSGKNVTLGSTQDGTSKIDAYQVAAGAAFAGSAAYAQNSLHGANAITIDSSTLQATGDNSSKGTLTVKAEDTSSAAVRTIGATAGAVAGGVLVTNATNNSDNTVTIGGSKLIAGKEYSYGNGYYNIGKVDVASVKANSITAETYGGMVGIAAAQGIVALATDAGSSKVNVTGASGLLGKSVSMNATNKPAVRAEAQAYSGGLLAVAGVAVSKAKASGTVEAKVADGSSFAADNVEITANVTTQTAKDENNKEYAIDNVSAKTIGATASGQYAAGFNTAYAENDMTVSVDVGKEQYNVNALKLKADNASVISADTLGITVGGYIASGSNWSDTKTNLTTSVKAAGVKGNDNSLGAVNISSSGYSAVNNDANGYGGGIVGFNPVAARSQNKITTNTTADVSGKWQNVGSLSVAANNADKLDILADSLTAAVVGASGTEIKNNVEHNANINVTGDITTSGKQSYIANNTLNHDVDLKGSGYGGGSVNVNDMDNVLKYTAGVNIDNANLSGTGSAGSIEALAYTDGKMNYSNTLKSAGVVPVTIAASKNVITYDNSINVTGSKLLTAKADQDITLAATDETTATFDTTADTQGGAVGAASAKTDNTLNRSNKITVTNGKILSTNDVNIYAGANLDGITSSLTYNVLADAYNKTAIPLATVPKAKNAMTQENQVSINGDIDSVRHVNFKAGKGMTTVSTSAREYNFYKGTSGSGSVTSTALGEVTPGETVANYVDIASGKKVRAGIHNNLELTISGSTKVTNPEFDKNGNVIKGKEGSVDFSGIKVETGAGQDWFDTKQNVTADVVELQNGLYARLQEINDLLGQYASTSDEYSILNSERNRIITQMEENGFVKTSVEGGKTYKSIFDKISLPAVDVKDIVVSGGNINIEADKLQGSGSLTAQGAKNLTINNSSDLYLKINDLAIKDKGGVIRYNDAEVSNVDGFNGTMNTAAGTNADPKITVKSTGTSNNSLTKADIGIFGTVQNSTGDVLIQNSNYNINVDGNANISARNIELKAEKGSVTQNSKGLLLIGGDPVTKYQFSDAIAKKIQSYVSNQAVNGKTTIDWLSNIGSYQAYKDALIAHKDDLGLTDAEVNEIRNYSVNKSSGIVAGNNVYISGLNVNLDGLVQSGYKNFKVTLDNAANKKIGNLDSDYARNRTALTNQYVMSNDKYCVSTKAGAVYNAATGAYDYTVKVYYNPATKELLTEAIEPNGGKIYITGALSSTGSGKLLAMDGTANIAIDTTNADRDLRVNKITNKDITGLISIKDTQKNTLTEYTTDGQKMSVKTITLDNRGNASSTSTTQVNGSATTYKPADGMTINWTGGTSGDKKIIKWQYEKDFVFWGLIKYGTTKDFVENEEVKNGKTEVSSSSITGADPLGQGTVIKVNNNAKEYGVTTKDYNNPDESTYTPVVENKKYSGVSGKIFGYGNCTYTWTETQMHSTSSTYTIKGDKEIKVGFMTGGSGDISVNSAKDMYLAGNISNATKDDGSAIGKVTLNSIDGAISSVGNARVDADDLTAKAAKGISINHSALGNMAKLNIEATTGDVSINSDRGKLQFVGGNKGALSGNLVINAAGDITTASDTVLNGNRIDFTSLGAINAAIAPGQTLTSSDTMSASVNANAHGNIMLTNSNGDMRIGHIASQTGDVSLTTSGSFIDAVGDSTLSDSESKLQKWQELGLINSNDKAEESAASAAVAKSERVQALENRAKQLAMADKKYTEDAQNAALAEYKALAEAYKTNGEAAFEGKNYSQDVKDWAKMYAEVDNSTAYGWSKNELLYAIQDSVLNAAPGQVLTVDKANVQGKNISLSAGKNIGIDGEATNIAYNEMGKLDNLKLLAQAKAGDLTWNDTDNRIEVRQQRQITVQLADGGKLNLKANTSGADNTGNVYLAGVKDTMLDISGTINTTQDVKLLSDKGVRMNNGSIVAKNLIIQGGNGDVGSKDAFIKTNISGNLEANTDTGHGVYLHQTAVDGKPAQVLTIQDAATGTLVLKADNGMQMTTEAGKNTGYLNANSINLQAANGDIGKADDSIRILENGAVINAKAENGSVYLQGAGTKDAGLVVDSITAKGNAKLNLDGDVNFGNDTGNGSISAGVDVTVNGNNVNLNAGTVTAGGASNINAGKDVNVTTGSITSSGAGNITAGNNVNLNRSTLAAGADSVITATNGNIALGSSGITVNGANNGLKLDANGSVMQDAAAAGITADNLTVESGKTQQLLSKSNKVKSLTIKGKDAGSSLMVDGVTRFNGTTDNLLVTVDDSHIKGDVLIENYQADTGKITINSTIDTSKYNDEHTGNITVKADGDITTAGGVNLNAADKVSINSKKGSVVTGGNVTANNDVAIEAAKDITASGSLTSTNANVDLLAGGSIMTNGTVNALNNVIANANGDINTNGDVTAENGKAKLNSSAGNVTTKNVKANKDVDIDAAQNIIANGNLTSETANVDLLAGGSITTGGEVKAQKNVDYNAKGSITTEDIINSTAGNIHLQTDAAKGDITFGGDVTAEHGNINIDVLQNGNVTDHDNKFTALGDKGDINSGNFALQIKGAGDVDLHEIYANNNALIDVANGNLTLAKIDGNLVALQLKTEGKQMKVDELIAGTKIIAQGSDIDLNKIQQRLDADGLLTIVPDGAQPDKPIDNLKIGEIITNKGVRFEHLWLNNGSIKVSEGMFHIDKLVVNNVAHFSNKHMKTAVWGAPPQRDGSDSVYWNNIAVNNPADNLTEWQQEGTNPDKWMYLHFTAQPNVQHSNGALLDLRNYDYVYDQRFTAVDHMLQQLNENKAEEYDINHAPDVVQYFRYDLYDLDEDDNKSEPVKITVEA